MEISSFNKNLGQESENLTKQIFLETCCDGCLCQSSKDHKKESSCLCGNSNCNC